MASKDILPQEMRPAKTPHEPDGPTAMPGAEIVKRKALYQASPDYVSRTIVGELVLVPVHHDLHGMIAVNATGALLFQWMETPKTADELALLLAERYRLPIEQARSDVMAFIRRAVAQGFVWEKETMK